MRSLSYAKLLVLLTLATVFLTCFAYFFSRYLQEQNAEFDEYNFAYSPEGFQYIPNLTVSDGGGDIPGSAVVSDKRKCAQLLSETASAKAAVYDDIQFCHLKRYVTSLADEPNGSIMIVPPNTKTVKNMQAYPAKDIGELVIVEANDTLSGAILDGLSSLADSVRNSGNSLTTINLGPSASAQDGVYIGSVVAIYRGSAMNNVRVIKAYNGLTKIASIYSTSDQQSLDLGSNYSIIGKDFTAIPDSTSSFKIFPRSGTSAFVSSNIGDRDKAAAACSVLANCKGYSLTSRADGITLGKLKTGSTPIIKDPSTILWI